MMRIFVCQIYSSIYSWSYVSSRTMTREWAIQDGTGGNEVVYDIGTDSLSNVYLTGFTEASLDGEPYFGYSMAFLMKRNPFGNLIWTKLSGSPGGFVQAYGLSIDRRSDNIYTQPQKNWTGRFYQFFKIIT